MQSLKERSIFKSLDGTMKKKLLKQKQIDTFIFKTWEYKGVKILLYIDKIFF